MIWSTGISLGVGLAIAVALIAANDPGEIFGLLLQAGWGLVLVVALNVGQIVASAAGWAPVIDDPRRPGLSFLARLRWIRVST